jgi:hypothetical protein
MPRSQAVIGAIVWPELPKKGLELEAGADTGARDRGRNVRDRRELDVLVFGTHENIGRERPVEAAADRETVTQRPIPRGAIAEGIINAGQRDGGIARYNRSRGIPRFLLGRL